MFLDIRMYVFTNLLNLQNFTKIANYRSSMMYGMYV